MAAALLLVVAGCSTGDDPAPTTGDGDDAVVVASFNFPESRLVAEIYAQALDHAGVPVRRELDLGPRELVLPALQQGLVDLVPEYSGTALARLAPNRPVDVRDAGAVHAALDAELARWGFTALTPAPAQNQNALAVTRPTALRLEVTSISDLAQFAPTLTLGGPPECPERRYCLVGLEALYGLEFASFVPLEGAARVVRGLREGVVDVGVVFTTDGTLAGRDLVMLDDDRGLQPVESLVPVISDRAMARYGDRARPALDAVSARLTTTALRFLDWRVSVAGKGVRTEARGWLHRQGLVP